MVEQVTDAISMAEKVIYTVNLKTKCDCVMENNETEIDFWIEGFKPLQDENGLCFCLLGGSEVAWKREKLELMVSWKTESLRWG